jgi:hypothetical protein
MNTFKEDLEFSNKYELELLNHLEYDKFEQVPNDISFSDYDIKTYLNNQETSYEVKVDRICNIKNSGNLAIEYECNNKKSGISTSKANYWALFAPFSYGGYELFIIARKKLIKMINNNEYIDNKKTLSGSEFVLFKKEQIKKNSIIYKTIY